MCSRYLPVRTSRMTLPCSRSESNEALQALVPHHAFRFLDKNLQNLKIPSYCRGYQTIISLTSSNKFKQAGLNFKATAAVFIFFLLSTRACAPGGLWSPAWAQENPSIASGRLCCAMTPRIPIMISIWTGARYRWYHCNDVINWTLINWAIDNICSRQVRPPDAVDDQHWKG